MSSDRPRALTDLSRAARLALTFLTVLPFPGVHDVRPGEFARASAFYPLAGWVVGALVALTLWLPAPVPSGAHAALAVVVWLSVTGLLHFDGLVDSADAVFVMKSPQRRREILKDVHVGAFGLAAGVLALLSLWSLLQAARPLDALIAAVVARAALLIPMRLFPAQQAGSLGGQSRASGRATALIALLLAAPVLFLNGGGAALLVAGLVSALWAAFCARRLGGGLNGDVYGACITLSELAALTALAWGRGV